MVEALGRSLVGYIAIPLLATKRTRSGSYYWKCVRLVPTLPTSFRDEASPYLKGKTIAVRLFKNSDLRHSRKILSAWERTAGRSCVPSEGGATLERRGPGSHAEQRNQE